MWASISSKVLIAVVSALATAGILWLVAKSGGLIEQVFIPELPGGAIVAFDGECPTGAGWVPYEDGAGKVLLGAGTGILRFRGPHRPKDSQSEVLLTPVAVGDQGGEELHKLTPGEMPNHEHNFRNLSKSKEPSVDVKTLSRGENHGNWATAISIGGPTSTHPNVRDIEIAGTGAM